MYCKLFSIALVLCNMAMGQHKLISPPVLQHAARISAALPTSITAAHAEGKKITAQVDSLEQLILAAFPALAEKMKGRSARLNAMTGKSREGEVLSLVPFNQKFGDYFRNEWKKMDALGRELDKQVKPFYGKEVYKAQGYLPAWDSVYRVRRVALIQYRDGVIQLVQAEIAYLEANRKMFESSQESERMQYVEEELSVLQKLVLLKDKMKRIIVEDGIEKVEYCKRNPAVCEGGGKK